MNVIYKMSNIFKVSLFIISIIFLSTNIVKSQEENSSENDFSKAENAEEKRTKWGTDEFKLELIKEMSSANIALFIDEHLKTITEPSRIYYKFSKESTREDSFTGNVVLNIVKVEDDNTKHITFRYLKGRNKVRFPPQIGAKGNPVFMLFFERDARDMQSLTGGNALFFRSRIRHTIAATEIKDVELEFQGDKFSGKQIKETEKEITLEGEDEESYLKIYNPFHRVAKLILYEDNTWVDADSMNKIGDLDLSELGLEKLDLK